MAEYTVVVTDHDFEDLSIERNELGDAFEVRDLTAELRAAKSNTAAASILAEMDADGVLNLRYELGEEAVQALADAGCRVIARYGIGVDNVATDKAAAKEMYVTNVPGYCIEEVTTHALSFLLALARRVPAYDASVSDGEWDRDVETPIHRFSELTVGIVGFGTIGRTVGKRVAAFGADVLASDPFVDSEDVVPYEVGLVEFETLLDRSDFVTIHSPLTDDTRGLFDDEAFALMNREAYLVNVARGPIVRAEALERALDEGEIAGAALDVFPDEPPAADDPLRTHDRVLTTPHIAWYSEEANTERRQRAAAAIRTVLSGDRPEFAIIDPT